MINFKIWLKNNFGGRIQDEKLQGRIEDLFHQGPNLGFWSVKSLEFTKFGI